MGLRAILAPAFALLLAGPGCLGGPGQEEARLDVLHVVHEVARAGSAGADGAAPLALLRGEHCPEAFREPGSGTTRLLLEAGRSMPRALLLEEFGHEPPLEVLALATSGSRRMEPGQPAEVQPSFTERPSWNVTWSGGRFHVDGVALDGPRAFRREYLAVDQQGGVQALAETVVFDPHRGERVQVRRLPADPLCL